MNTAYLLSALLMGIAGSFHCIGMCGPIALAIPSKGTKINFIFGRLIYNAGRIITYSLIGVLTGLIGYSATLSGFQSELSLVAGLLIITAVLLIISGKRFRRANSSLALATSFLKKKFKFFFGRKNHISLLIIGMLNGILPCGLVYMAAIASLATGNLTDSIIYMAVFGAGTLPVMLAVSLAGPLLSMKWRKGANKAAPYVAVLVGVLLIWRGITVKEADCCSGHDATTVEVKAY